MGLSSYKVSASIAVADMARAEAFYEGKLGLLGVDDPGDGSHRYACGEGTSLHVYVSPANAGQGDRDVGHLVRPRPRARGRRAQRQRRDLRTVRRPSAPDRQARDPLVSSGKVAWFKDPDGNTFALEQ
jgi:catechol 2,3-dioxygenase-like lactoylglutathione lyase family enzyme